MHLPKQLRPVFFFTLGYVSLFGVYATISRNIEFLFYVAVVIIVFWLLLAKQSVFQLSTPTLWLLSIWGLLHMLGGNVPVHGSVLYNLWLIPSLLKYDQLVHLFGFGAATLLCYELLAPVILPQKNNRGRLLFLLAMMGLGLGALNEIIEFVAVLTIPDTNVGGYENTAWDLVFDLFGAVLATVYIAKKRLR